MQKVNDFNKNASLKCFEIALLNGQKKAPQIHFNSTKYLNDKHEETKEHAEGYDNKK